MGRYQARIRLDDGSLLPAPATFATKREASLWLAETVTDRHRGLWVDPRQARVTTVAEWGEFWWPSMADLKPKTLAGYRSALDSLVLPTFGRTLLDDVKPSAVRTWVAAASTVGLPDRQGHRRTVSPSRIRTAHGVLSQLMDAAVRDGLLVSSPCAASGRGRRSVLPRLPEPMPKVITREQARAIVAHSPEPYRALVEVLAWCGLRLGEALALRRSSVDLDAGLLTVSESLTDANGILEGVTPHALRRSVGSWLADAGTPILDVAAYLGHSRTNVTHKHYARSLDERGTRVAAAIEILRGQ